MKKTVLASVRQLFKDRTLTALVVALVVAAIVYAVYVSLSVSPTELQIATRYSAFGETQYYRNKWYYLLTFIGFGAILAIVHISLMAKLVARSMRSQAIGLGLFSLILIGILFLVTHSVLGVAYLS
ncbi:MAG TPA: hypothetical protein VGE34_04800 [Candidatus Saccharimonadales bacterium]